MDTVLEDGTERELRIRRKLGGDSSTSTIPHKEQEEELLFIIMNQACQIFLHQIYLEEQVALNQVIILEMMENQVF